MASAQEHHVALTICSGHLRNGHLRNGHLVLVRLFAGVASTLDHLEWYARQRASLANISSHNDYG